MKTWSVYTDLADEWYLILNADDEFEEIANSKKEEISVYDEIHYDAFRRGE